MLADVLFDGTLGSSVLAVVVGLFLAAAVSALAQFVLDAQVRVLRRRQDAAPPDATARLNELIASLNAANDAIREIEREVRERTEIAARLRDDAAHAEKLLELNREQLDAVKDLFGSELRKESSRSFWLGAALNFLFFLAGVGVTLLLR